METYGKPHRLSRAKFKTGWLVIDVLFIAAFNLVLVYGYVNR